MPPPGVCKVKCYPLIYNILSKALPACNTTDQIHCMWNAIVHKREGRYKCLKSKTINQFNADTYTDYNYKNYTTTGIILQLYFVSDTIELKEEILVVSTGQFIGSIGGSLGLFLGFSFFTYFSGLLDKIFA